MAARLHRASVVPIVLLLFAARARAQTPPAPDYAALAAKYRETRGLNDLPADESALQGALERSFAAIDVGHFDLRFPWTALTDAKRGDEFKQLVLGLIDVQARWLQWLDEREQPSGKELPPPPELAAMRAWVATWKMDAIRKSAAASDASRSLLALTHADEKVAAAVKGFAQAMRSGAAARLTLEGAATKLVLTATRSEFDGFTAFAGSLNEEWKKMLWTPALPARVEFHLNELLCLALVRPAGDGSDAGIDMNRDGEKTGLLEHVAQYAADRLMRRDLGAALDPGFEMGASVDVVVEVYGQNNSRVAGSGEGNKTPARVKFVRGGRSSGGKLAKISADTQWRKDKGKDYFSAALRLGQFEGGKQAQKEKPGSSALANFSLNCLDDPGVHELATAPFLGNYAAMKDIPDNFFADYQEFIRAYRAGFARWLMTEAKPKDPAAPPRPFARLLRSCVIDREKPFEERIAAIWGVPLTSSDPSTDALEWQYLAWLSRSH